MGRNPLVVVALSALLTACTGPGRGITGNDTGGIIPYSPAVEGSYRHAEHTLAVSFNFDAVSTFLCHRAI